MTDLISSTKDTLKKILPNARNVFVKVERDHGLFLSKIHVHVPGSVFHVQKKAETISDAIESSYKAIIKKIDKLKTKRSNKRKNKIRFYNELHPPSSF